MNYFSMKEIERMSGIKSHTLRIWEQRYGLSFCKRKESQHRYFDDEDLKEVLGVAQLYHRGCKISKIAALSKNEIRELAHYEPEINLYAEYIEQMINATMYLDEVCFEKAVVKAVSRMGFEQTLFKVFYPFLEKIGLLWLSDLVTPAQEHFSFCLIQKRMLGAINGLKPAHQHPGASVLLFAPENEHHELPLLVIQYLLKKQGIKTVFFGVNVSLSTIEYYCQHKKVTHLCCHLITNFLQHEPEEYLDCLAGMFPDKKIIASGPAFQNISAPPNQVTVLKSLAEMREIGNRVAG